jgi:probable rRNA maturation factor
METREIDTRAALPHSACQVELSDTQAHLAVDPEALLGLARRVLAREGRIEGTVSVALVDDATIHALNCRHLGHDWPTDVLSFPLAEPGEQEFSGALVLSAEMAARTAREAGLDAWPELALYLVHGLLHLCGHDDQTPEACARMRQREQVHLAAEDLTNTFALGADVQGQRERLRWTV